MTAPVADQPLIIPSGQCSIRWLERILPPLWFGGDHEPDLRMLPTDCRPVRVDRLERDCNGGLN